ncbi:WG repeat-containing protein [Paenibacillus koleovorans]|uniref:WG repeat-containing protein n=1 Tax=Paenibacillus koleovorans TaxID=121608 RepID=UPI000FDA0BD1|nr:WG repeat-containing protein [Paenibacillus koleovorans]
MWGNGTNGIWVSPGYWVVPAASERETSRNGWRTPGEGNGHNLRAVKLYPMAVMTTSGTKWGYMNDRGAVFIQPHFDSAADFQSNGLAVVQVGDLYGLLKPNGEFAVKPQFGFINDFHEGRAVAYVDQGSVVIDEQGHILTSQTYTYIGTYSDGLALFSKTDNQSNYLYGYLDLKGQEAIPAQYKSGTDFKKGKAVVQVNDREHALIGHDGKRLATYPYPRVGELSEGLLAYQAEPNGKMGYIDEQGRQVIAPQFTYAEAFKDGRAVVNMAPDYNNEYGLIDRTGKWIMKPLYNSIELLGEQRASIGEAIDPEQPYIGSKYALADAKNGPLLTGFQYASIGPFEKGLASASDGKLTFFLTRDGHLAPHSPKVSGNGTLNWVGSLIKANVDQRLSYYDRWGKLIWRQTANVALTPPLKVKEGKYRPNKDYFVYYPQFAGMRNIRAQQAVNRKLKMMSQVKPVPANTQLDYSYSGDYSVAFYKDLLLVLELTGYNYPFGAAHGSPSKVYAHVNTKTGQFYQLKDLFKPDSNYAEVLGRIVGEQIKNDPQYDYVFPDSYKGISPDQPFYVTEHALHLYFNPYDIGPYAVGFPTFRIPYTEIETILNKQGSFWKSFHQS